MQTAHLLTIYQARLPGTLEILLLTSIAMTKSTSFEGNLLVRETMPGTKISLSRQSEIW